MPRVTVKVDGLREIDQALGRLTKATGRNVLRRVAVEQLEPMAEVAKRLAPDNPATGGHDLRNSIAVGTKLTKKAGKLNSRGKSFAEAFMGPSSDGGGGAPPQGVQQEFGNQNHGPQSFMRPAWDGGKDQLLDGIADNLWAEIGKATARMARKAARLAAKG